MDPPEERVLAAARAARPRAGATAVIAIDGRSGAGKSTLAGRIAVALGAPVVALEDLYGGWEGLEEGVGLLVRDVLVPLAAGRRALVPRYDWRAGSWCEPWALEPPPRLIVEGVGAGARSVAPFTSLLVWLELSAPVRAARALRRDGVRDAAWRRRWAALEEAHFARESPCERADLVIDGDAGEPPPR